MDLQKYKNLLFQNIKRTLTQWFESDKIDHIPSLEVYRFIHSVKGTAGTLGLGGLMHLSEQLLEKLDENHEFNWQKQDLQEFLFQLIELTYQYEHFDERVMQEEIVRNHDTPLIQIIDDDLSMLILLKDVLEEKGWMVITSVDPEKAVEQYFDMQPDCLIIDIQLPEKNGFELLQDIQEHNEKYFIPKLMISIQNDKQTRIKAYQTGADDFIPKPVEIDEFVVKIERHLQRKKLFDQSVLIDELTQVYNRKFLKEYFTKHLQESKRTGQAFSICLLDLDHFKQVNDTYGHLMGDHVLTEFAHFIKSKVRSFDLVYRFGGEEFVIIFPRATDMDVQLRVTEMIQEFSHKIFIHENDPFSVSFSAGIHMIDDCETTLKEAIKEADAALYEAKRLGRARAERSQSKKAPYKKKVLHVSIVDDDIIIRSILGKMLNGLQSDLFELKVGIYEDGQSFIESPSANNGENHFLILDGMMPVMDGLEVLQEVKRGRYADRFTVLMLTGRKSDGDIAMALKLGADDYVTKPFSITELQARVERLLQRMR